MVDVVAAQAEVPGDGDEALGEALRAADVELALAQVGDELVDEARCERNLAAVADEAVQAAAALGDELLDLLVQHQLRLVVGAEDDVDVGVGGQVLEHRPDRRDADAGRD